MTGSHVGMAGRVRIERGVPRGGAGYLGPVLAAGAFAAAMLSRSPRVPPFPIVGPTCMLVPLVAWLALGLRHDGQDEECIDRLTWESPRRSDWFGTQDHRVIEARISTLAVLGSLAAVGLAVWPR